MDLIEKSHLNEDCYCCNQAKFKRAPYPKNERAMVAKTILILGTRCARCKGLESTQGRKGRILVVVVVMTTWLRVGVEGNEQEQKSLDKPQRPFFIKINF